MSVQEDMQRFTEDAIYFDEHRQELLQQYPEQWVAVYNKQVMGAAEDIHDLVEQLKRKGISPGYAYREYVTAEEIDLIVPSRSQ